MPSEFDGSGEPATNTGNRVSRASCGILPGVGDHSRSGTVIVLNGASSAGKSTLALALQQALAMDERPWVVFSWDDFVPRLPERWTSVPGATGDQALDGCSYRIVRDEPLEALLEVRVRPEGVAVHLRRAA